MSKTKVTAAFNLARRILESNTFSKDNVNHVNVNTESNSDHIYSGLVSTLHFHDNTPLLEHCASEKCNIQWADENDKVQLQIKLLRFKYFFPHQRLIAEALWESDLNYFHFLKQICSLSEHYHLGKALKGDTTVFFTP